MDNKHYGWGGKRVNAGRKAKLVKAEPKTKPCRITHHQCDLIKSGKLTELENLLFAWKMRIEREPNSDTSPRWERMREFMGEVEMILGEDSTAWIDSSD